MAATYGGDTTDILEQTTQDTSNIWQMQYPSEIQKIFEIQRSRYGI